MPAITHQAPTLTLKLRVRESGNARTPAVEQLQIRSARRVEPGGPARNAEGPPVEVQADELVRVEYENGLQLWLRADDLVRERGRAGSTRGAGAEPVWDIDTAPTASLHGDAPAGTRGVAGLGIKALEFFGVDVLEGVSTVLASALETRQLQGNAPGLYQWKLNAGEVLRQLPDDEVLPSGQPVLLFLHGTMSSCRGSFGDIELDKPGADGEAGRAARQALCKAYGEGIYAFEHRTLTESPISNALALARRLPEGAQLHLVSHSRGGLVGELLCLAERDVEADALAGGVLDELFAEDRTIAPMLGLPMLAGAEADGRQAAYAADLARLRELLQELDRKRIRVRRFVRVACPARGTTLASGRLDRWLSVLDMLAGNSLFGEVADFLLGVVKKRTDPRTMPGIEAMMPGSATTRLLALPGLVTRSDLSVIAGDVEGDSLWGKLKLLAVDWFYGAEHDLVVNTGSMSGGLRRPDKGARWLQARGAQVNHFRYFANPASLDWMVKALVRADADSGGFLPFEQARVEEPRWRAAVQRSREATTPKPIVMVIPGTMGSQLTLGDSPVWLNYWALLRGGLADIGWGAQGVKPLDLLGDFYGPLLEYLARDHRVEIFPYDWRCSVRDTAGLLAEKLTALVEEAERTRQPLHIVAHSMGGLVARAMIADGKAGSAVWKRMGALEAGSRLLMLGTPNRGSHEAVRWLVGMNPTQAKLALLDFRHGVNGIIDIVRRFPGMAELLPFDADAARYAQVATWKEMRDTMGLGFRLIEQSQLDAAGQTWSLLLKAAPDGQRMVYVAGCQRATVVDWRYTIDDGTPAPRRIDWLATAEGDGTVPWASGRLDGVAMFYAEDTAHDELCANAGDRRIFRGYVDLLARGHTDQLSATPPQRRRAAGESPVFVLPSQPVADDIPDEAALRGAGFGGTRRRRLGQARQRPLIDVSVRHADLSYARHAVLVGHYQGDTIVSAEASLDRRLNQALTRCRVLGLYPGPHGSHAVFFNEAINRSPRGAVVVGLGPVGELSAGRLESSLRDAMLEFALRMLQRPEEQARGGCIPVRLSSLLVGSGAAGLTLRECVPALLRAAVRANRRLEDAQLDGRVHITAIEIIELYEDVAIGAAHALADALRSSDVGKSVRWEPATLESGPGRRKRRFYDEDRSWDQRIEIVLDDEGQLCFNVATNRARAEERLATGQLSLAETFVQQASASTARNDELGNTLFELLLPRGFKDAAPDQRDMVLMLDAHTACLPWELLQDGQSRTGQPLAIEAGIVRQLKTADFREHPSLALGDTAFVIGDPNLEGNPDFSPLPGAQKEATAVRDALEAVFGSDNVSAVIGGAAREIVSGLHHKPWRILHLAGHGVHDFLAPQDPAVPGPAGIAGEGRRSRKPVSGMVIGNGKFLTPGDVEQMRCVPELVFVNCCFLGRTDVPPNFARLAANLGAQFINMGVRVVVCAGWAVDDAAALTFAATFYADLLAGRCFREAVKHARVETRDRHPDCNTWGAYQCYGDPDWRLRLDGLDIDAGRGQAYVSVRELVADLDNLAEFARVQVAQEGQSDKVLAQQLEQAMGTLCARVPKGQGERWLARAEVAAGIGFIWGEALVYDKALQSLEAALEAADGDCPVSVFEQIVNLSARQAASDAQERLRAGTASAKVLAAIARRIRRTIHQIDLVSLRAPTPERLSLLGAAYKRLAWVQVDKAERAAALQRMAEAYGRALQRRSSIDNYAFTNWAIARLLVEELAPGPLPAGVPEDWREQLKALTQRQVERAKVSEVDDPGFWNGVALADLAVVRLLLASGDADACGALALEAVEGYRAALARGASPRNAGSVREHLRFMCDITASMSDTALHEALKTVADAV